MTDVAPLKKGRVWIAAIAWLLCVPGMLMHMVYLLSWLNVAPKIFAGGEVLSEDPGGTWILFTLPLSVLAWPILAFMTFSWIDNRKVHWPWLILGTFCASAWWAPTGVGGLWLAVTFTGPGMLLACYLIYWHIHQHIVDART